MDLSNPQRAISTLATAQEQSSNSSIMAPFKCDIFLSTYNRRQRFTLPNSMMHYVAKNPKNANVYQKMVQSCKYFFIKNPILVLSDLQYYRDEWRTWINGKAFRKFNMKNISSKIWIISNFHAYSVYNSIKDLVSAIFPKIYRCDAKRLNLSDQTISFHVLMFLCLSVKDLHLYRVIVKNDDDTEVPFDKLIQQIPNLNKIEYSFLNPSNNTSKNTFKELWKIPHLSNYDVFYLNKIPEDFDIDSFYSFMKKNKNTRMYLTFSDQISEVYKARLKAIVDEIIDAKNHEYKVPCIEYPGIDRKKYLDIYSIFYRR